MLVKVLTAHVVAGKISGKTLMARIKANGGSYNMSTVSGDALTAKMRGKSIYIYDENGGASRISISESVERW